MAYKFNKLKSIKKGLIGPNILFPAAYLLFSAEVCTGRGTNNPGHPMQQVLRSSLPVNPVDPLDMKKDLERAEGNVLAADEPVDPSDKVVEGLEGSEDDTEELKAANPDDALNKIAENLEGSEGKTNKSVVNPVQAVEAVVVSDSPVTPQEKVEPAVQENKVADLSLSNSTTTKTTNDPLSAQSHLENMIKAKKLKPARGTLPLLPSEAPVAPVAVPSAPPISGSEAPVAPVAAPSAPPLPGSGVPVPLMLSAAPLIPGSGAPVPPPPPMEGLSIVPLHSPASGIKKPLDNKKSHDGSDHSSGSTSMPSNQGPILLGNGTSEKSLINSIIMHPLFNKQQQQNNNSKFDCQSESNSDANQNNQSETGN